MCIRDRDHTELLPGTYAKLHRSLARQVLIGKSDVVFLEKESNQEGELALDERSHRNIRLCMGRCDIPLAPCRKSFRRQLFPSLRSPTF